MNNQSNIIKSIPFMFEKNIGQHNNESQFILKNSGSLIYFLNSEIVLALIKYNNDIKEKSFFNKFENKNPGEFEINSIKIKFDNSNIDSIIEGLEKSNCKVNYFKKNEKNKWFTDIGVYGKLIYKNIYDNIDLVFYGEDGILEYDFIVSPNGEVENIKLSIDGANKLELDEEGNLLITLNNNIITMLKPKAYQVIDDKKVDIESNFIIENNTIKFNVSDYDKSKELVIDPPLLYGTYMGGTDYESAYRVAVDAKEYAYITGYTYSSVEFPIINPYQGTIKGYIDAYLIKIDTKLSGSASLKYATYIGGSENDYGYCVAVDTRENAYIVGETGSLADFPLKNAYQTLAYEAYQGFLVKLDTKLSGEASLKYSTYIGGNLGTSAYGVAVDANEYAYITGRTFSNELFPLKNAFQNELLGDSDAFLVKINTKAIGIPSLLYGTYIGGNNGDNGYAVAVDANEYAYITGETSSTEQFPLNTPIQFTLNGPSDTFLVKLNTAITQEEDPWYALLYGTYIGGNGFDVGTDIAIDANENAYIVGYTNSYENFPLRYAYEDTLTGNSGGFLVKIKTDMMMMLSKIENNTSQEFIDPSLLYGTYISSGYDCITTSVAVDEQQNAYVVGATLPTKEFPLKYAFKNETSSYIIGYLLKFNTNAIGKESLEYGTYVGGNYVTFAEGVAIDKKYNAYIVGQTQLYSEEYDLIDYFPLKNAYQDTLKGYEDGFLVKLNTLVTDLIIDKFTCMCKPCLNNKVPYTMTITNKGPHKSTNIVLTDILPDSLRVESFIATTGSVGKSGNKLVWKIPVLEVGQRETLKIVITLNKTTLCLNNKAGEYITNTISVISDNTTLNYYSTIDTDILYVDCNCL